MIFRRMDLSACDPAACLRLTQRELSSRSAA
jgi:hypothetical protein